MKTPGRIFLTGILIVSGCTHYTLIEPERRQVSEFFSVEPQIQWSRIKSGTVQLWTVDGPLLQSIRIFDGVKDGNTLLPSFNQKMKRPLFRAGMTATEVQEFIVDSIAADGAADVSASNLRPFQFGTLPGFRFEFQFLSRDGLEHDGVAAGVTNEDQLYLILYTGTRIHYFEKYGPHVERMLQSIRIEI